MMSSETGPRVVLLVAIDDSPASVRAATVAARFMLLPGSEVHLVHVIPPLEGLPLETALEAARELLQSTCKASGLGPVAMLHISTGVPWREIVQLAANLHADAVIVGTRDRGAVSRMLLGSVAEEVTKKAGCPVYVTRAKNHAAATPEIEPPCPTCVETQERTRGGTLWCARHSERHTHGHVQYAIAPPFEIRSNLIRV